MKFCFKILPLFFIYLHPVVAEHINILHLTDLHYDIFYKPNSSIYSFCHRNLTDENDEKSNSLWGRECDSSGSLIQKSLMHISKQKHNISVILLTGDNIRHDDDDRISISLDEIIWGNNQLKTWFQDYFTNIPVIFSIGNNDVMVHDALISKSSIDLASLGNIWMKDFSKEQAIAFQTGGFYSLWIIKKIKAISLNTLYFFKNNFLAEDCKPSSSPGSVQLEWLESELKDLQNRGAKALIVGHIPPIKLFYHENCLEKLLKLFNEYSNIISFQTYGHIHIDDFFIVEYSKVPMGVALVSPALSPVFNPSYRIYEVDQNYGSLLDYHQYYAPLDAESFNFVKEYSFKEAFGEGPLTLEYFINIKLHELKNSSLRIQRKRYGKVRY